MAGIDGCLDVIFTVLIFVLSRCEGKLECLLTGLFVKSVTNAQRNLWIIRMFIGLFINIVDFVLICALSNGDFLDDVTRKILFSIIICCICFVYCGFIGFTYCEGTNKGAWILYKFCDMFLDGLLLAYALVIAGEVNEPPEIVCLVIVIIDIILNFVSIFYGVGKFSIECIESMIKLAKLSKEEN